MVFYSRQLSATVPAPAVEPTTAPIAVPIPGSTALPIAAPIKPVIETTFPYVVKPQSLFVL